MKILVALLAFAVPLQDDAQERDKKARELAGKLPDDAARAELIKMGKPILPVLTQLHANQRIQWGNANTPAAIGEVIDAIRGWKEPAALTLKAEQQVKLAASLVVRSKEDADTYFDGWEKALPGFDFKTEMILVILPDAILQTIDVTDVTSSAEKKTLTVGYTLTNHAGCGNCVKADFARAIVVPKSDFAVVFKSAK